MAHVLPHGFPRPHELHAVSIDALPVFPDTRGERAEAQATSGSRTQLALDHLREQEREGPLHEEVRDRLRALCVHQHREGGLLLPRPGCGRDVDAHRAHLVAFRAWVLRPVGMVLQHAFRQHEEGARVAVECQVDLGHGDLFVEENTDGDLPESSKATFGLQVYSTAFGDEGVPSIPQCRFYPRGQPSQHQWLPALLRPGRQVDVHPDINLLAVHAVEHLDGVPLILHEA
mmetsp:Transcript_120132/g.299696  ORF Transcript_120132/g.299696 Transcript_120132/m.299696 type:complete len:230 (+) Transcript_120132:394-1083(+)